MAGDVGWQHRGGYQAAQCPSSRGHSTSRASNGRCCGRGRPVGVAPNAPPQWSRGRSAPETPTPSPSKRWRIAASTCGSMRAGSCSVSRCPGVVGIRYRFGAGYPPHPAGCHLCRRRHRRRRATRHPRPPLRAVAPGWTTCIPSASPPAAVAVDDHRRPPSKPRSRNGTGADRPRRQVVGVGGPHPFAVLLWLADFVVGAITADYRLGGHGEVPALGRVLTVMNVPP
jgi:hypothetical protein